MAVLTQPTATGTIELPSTAASRQASVELYWLPLGAGGWFVRRNGRLWETTHALLEHRRPQDLYHTALVVRVPEGRYVVENCWPIPDSSGPARGCWSKARSSAAGWGACGCSATRCAAGATG